MARAAATYLALLGCREDLLERAQGVISPDRIALQIAKVQIGGKQDAHAVGAHLGLTGLRIAHRRARQVMDSK